MAPVVVKCLYCGKKHTYKSPSKAKDFCDRSCANKANAIARGPRRKKKKHE